MKGESLTYFLSVGVVMGIIVLIVTLLYVGVLWYQKKESCVTRFISKYVLQLGFFAALFGTLLSLFYSQVLHFVPCELCWFQRIFLYPLIFIFGLAWYRNDRNILPYTLLLSGIGLAIAIYHHMLQIGFDLMKPCSNAPFAVDCAKPEFMEFGFVTFPLMSAVLFGFLVIMTIIGIKFRK